VEFITEARRLTILVRDVSKVLVDPGIPPIPGIPWDMCMAGNLLEAVGVISDYPQEAYATGHGPWD
jgi:hypothetical protein